RVSASCARNFRKQWTKRDHWTGHLEPRCGVVENRSAFRLDSRPIPDRLLQRLESSEPGGAPLDAEFRGFSGFWRSVRSAISPNRAIWIKIFMVRNFIVIPLVLMLAQKPVRKPDVHADFQ